DAFLELRGILHHRGLRDAEARIFRRRLHEQWKAQLLRQSHACTARKHGELRRRDAMVGEQLLAEDLVARQQQAARVAAGVWLPQELEERHYVLVVRDDAVEFLQQVEDDLRLPLQDLGAQFREAVTHTERLDVMAGIAQVRDDVVLAAPLLDLLVAV